MNIGILGGTFNPIHNGHIHAGKKIYEKLGLDKLVFIPVNIPPHKEVAGNVCSNSRLTMVKNAIKDYDCFEVSDIEIKRTGVSYTIDTIKELVRKNKNDNFFLIIGMDQFLVFHKWKDYKEIFKYVSLVVMNREADKLRDDFEENILKDYSEKIIFIDINPLLISSVDIRYKRLNNEDISSLAPFEILKIIENERLYI